MFILQCHNTIFVIRQKKRSSNCKGIPDLRKKNPTRSRTIICTIIWEKQEVIKSDILGNLYLVKIVF